MTEFPELQYALVDAARARYGRSARTWRVVRPVLVAAACVAVAALVALLAGARAPDEQVPSPAVTPEPTALEKSYAVFRRPATAADTLPSVEALKRYWIHREDVADFDPSQARLVAQDGDSQVFLVGWTFEGRPWINAVLFYRGEARVGGGGVIGDPQLDRAVIGSVVMPPDGKHPAAVVAAAADSVDEVIVTFADHSTEHLPVRDNAVYAPLDRWPVSLAWDDADGVRHSEPVPADHPSAGPEDLTPPPVPTPTPTPAG